MEKAEVEKSSSSEETTQLSRNRSFKSKQLVRSQAIRESASPPRTASPCVVVDAAGRDDVIADVVSDVTIDKLSSSDERSDVASEDSRRHRVEIQITQGTWDEPSNEQRQRTKRWLGNKQHSRDLLSNNPRVACVCGACNACPHCRGRRRKYLCPTKQDSGIVCSDDCPDCSDTEPSGGSNSDGARKTNSLDREDQTFYCRCPERKEKPKSISLSRTDSDDRSEPTGPDLVKFIKETLNKNARDRVTLLKIEKELHSLINDTGRCIVRFPVMSSYGRMLVHRCAALFQLSHHLDSNNKTCVLVSKSGTCGGRVPCTSFKQWCTATFPPSPQRHHADVTHAKSILKRDTHSLDEPGSGSMNAARSKSLEQREREYERVRRRIFSTDNCSQDEASQWQWMNSGPIKLLTPEGGRNKLLKVQSLESSGPHQRSAALGRGAVSKSHSFGGYGRPPDPPRVLSRQGDLASSSWRLSPSSSGYRTLSLHSTDSVTPSPTGGASPEPPTEGVAVMWAVTEFSAVPPGAIVIHPQTGRPLTNPDGSLYHFDPANPPVVSDASVYAHAEQKVDVNNEKKRGRLEKQHSFMDNECYCQPSEECGSNCCECRRHDSCHRANSDKQTPPQSEQKTHQTPSSPCKTRYEQPAEVPTNHNPPPDISTNHRPAYDPAVNQKQIPDVSANTQSVYDALTYNASTNNKPSFEIRTSYESNQRQERQFEIQRPPSYEASQKYEATNQRGPVEQANHRAARPTNHGTPEVQYISQQYQQGFSHEEQVSSPLQPQYLQQDMSQLAQVKPVALPDPNMRPVSLGMVYPGVGQYYGSSLPVYQPAQPSEDQKLAPTTINNTFTIDPSYPYAPVDYLSQCTACSPPAGQAVPPRPYTLYTPVDPMMYQQHYPYQDPLQWQNMQPMVPLPSGQKMYVPELCPVMPYPASPAYPQYNVLYPQMVPQLYPVFPKPEQRASLASHTLSNRNSLPGSSRNTPLTTTVEDKKVPYEDTNLNLANQSLPQTHPASQSLPAQHHVPSQALANQQNLANQNSIAQQGSSRDSSEIAAKIKQINDQMSQMHTRERDRDTGKRDGRRDEWKRRNSGNGILGSYPLNGRIVGRMPSTEEVQLSSAARAIVNSIRHMQAKNNYGDRRGDCNAQYRCDRPRADGRPRRDDKERDRRPLPVYTPPYLLRQMSPGAWCRRSPAPVHPVFNPRRPHPDTRGGRR